MKVEVHSISSCCGGKSTIFKTNMPVTIDIIKQFIDKGFIELKHFTDVGLIYVHNSDFIITGPIGSNRLQVKCKKSKCDQNLKELENLLMLIE